MRWSTGPRAWVWAALAIQLAGLAWDVAWHGLLCPDTEDLSLAHVLLTHVVFNLGVVALLASTAWALVDQVRQVKHPGAPLTVASAASVGQTVG